MKPILPLEAPPQLITERTGISLVVAWTVGLAAMGFAAYAAQTLQRMDDRLQVLEAQMARVERKLDGPAAFPFASPPAVTRGAP